MLHRQGLFKPSSDTLAITGQQPGEAQVAPGELLRIRIAVLQSWDRCVLSADELDRQDKTRDHICFSSQPG